MEKAALAVNDWVKMVNENCPCPCSIMRTVCVPEMKSAGGRVNTRLVPTGRMITRHIVFNPDPKVWADPSKPYDAPKFHLNAAWEMHTKSGAVAGGHGQQCMYDADGQLINEGFGAGTPDFRQARGVLGGIRDWSYGQSYDTHWAHDVEPFNLAYALDGDSHGKFVDKYIEVRQPNKGRDEEGKPCPPNTGE